MMYVTEVEGESVQDLAGRWRDVIPVVNCPPGSIEINGTWRDVIPVTLVVQPIPPLAQIWSVDNQDVHPIRQVVGDAYPQDVVPVSGLA